MEPEQSARLEHILEHMPVGVAILDCASLRFRYANPYLLSLLEEPWRSRGVIGHGLKEVVSEEVRKVAEPVIQQVCATGQKVRFDDVPYEGSLEMRGRTYWRVSIELAPGSESSEQKSEGLAVAGSQNVDNELLVTIEDVTGLVRSRLHLDAIRYISSAIAGPFALPRVLDRILQSVQELVGSTRCAVLLIDDLASTNEAGVSGSEEPFPAEKHNTAPMVTVAAQRGMHASTKDWHPELSEQLLVGQVVRDRHSLIIPDTHKISEVTLPYLDDNGRLRRPGSVLCVPIFEPAPNPSDGEDTAFNGRKGIDTHTGAVLGTIEVYHRRARKFPAEEVELLGQFAQQAGLAIQNARLFLSIDRYAMEQANARERTEAEIVARTKELALRNTALQEAKAALELESARMQLLLERLPSCVMLISAADNHISIINHQAVALMQHIGWLPAQDVESEEVDKRALGMNIEELLRTTTVYGDPGSIIPYEQQPLFLALHKGEASEAELHIPLPDGQTLYLLVNAAPLRAHDGLITDIVVVWHEITRLKTLERAREDFFTTMAHELKTPLANIRAHLSALQASDLQWSPQEQHDFLETADEQVERLVGMINHFLDASRVEAGALRLELEPILLPELFEDLQDRLEALITSSHRTLEIHVPSGLPAVSADYELIMSVLTNLLSNALRYAPEGDIVRLEAEPISTVNDTKPKAVEIRVIDRGPGITEEQQAELFTRFSTFAARRRPAADRPGQPVAEAEKQPGSIRWSPATGLGLYISRGIIEAHDSTLRLKSSPGQGTIFAFTLDVATSEMNGQPVGPVKKEVG